MAFLISSTRAPEDLAAKLRESGHQLRLARKPLSVLRDAFSAGSMDADDEGVSERTRSRDRNVIARLTLLNSQGIRHGRLAGAENPADSTRGESPQVE